MDCDIHSFVEKKISKGRWSKITGFKSDDYYEKSEYFSSDRFLKGDSPLSARNYQQFAILANVRNGRGFAGLDTGDRVEPIAMPKGMPDDVSDDVLNASNEWGCDGHSHSWLTAKEINEYDSEIKIIRRGFVSAKVYEQFLKDGNPYPYCGGVYGDNVVIKEKGECLDFQKNNPTKEVYTKIQWEVSARNAANWLFGGALDQLMARSENKKGDDVRIVFWFDN